MLPQLKACKRIVDRFRMLWLGVISCGLCLLLSITPLKTWGHSSTKPMRSRLLEPSTEQLTAQGNVPMNAKPVERSVLVTEVVVQGASKELQAIALQAIALQPGQVTTKTKLQQDINAIFKTGWFRNVKAVPEDTPQGVRVTFVVQVNPVLRQVKLVSPLGNQLVLPATVVDDIFRSQYGKTLNLQTLQTGINQLKQWYQTNDYVLAQVLGQPPVSEDGIVTLQIAEGVIESIHVQFVSADQPLDADESIVGKTPTSLILQVVKSKPGMVFNHLQMEKDVRRVFGLGIFQDAKVSLNPGKNPHSVIVVFKVQELSGDRAKLVEQAERVIRAETYLQQERTQNDPIAEATALRTLAQIRSDKALYQAALKRSQASGDRAGEADALKGLAYFYNSQAKFKTNNGSDNENRQSFDQAKKKQAIVTYQAALKIYQALQNDTQVAIILNNLGYLFHELEDYPAAIATYQQLLPHLQTLKQPFWQALAANNLAASYWDIGDVDKALLTQQQALRLWQSLRSKPSQLASSSLLSRLNQPDDLQSYLVGQWKNSAKNRSQADIRVYLGSNTLEPGGLIDVQFGEAMTLLSIGGIYQATGDYQQALYAFKSALPHFQIPPYTIQSLIQDGSVDSPYSSEILKICSETMEALGLYLMSTLYTDMGWQSQAQSYRDRALTKGQKIVEQVFQVIIVAEKDAKLSSDISQIASSGLALVTEFIHKQANGASEEMSFERFLEWFDPIMQRAMQTAQIAANWQWIRPWLPVFKTYALAEEWAKAGQFQLAVDAYRTVLAQWDDLPPLPDLQNPQPYNTETSTFAAKLSVTGNLPLFAEAVKQAAPLLHATVYNAMGKALVALGNRQDAIAAHQQALQALAVDHDSASGTLRHHYRSNLPDSNQIVQVIIAQFQNDVSANTFEQLGKAYATNQQADLALASYRRAVPLWRKARNMLREADTYWEMAIVQRQQGDLAAAKTQIETAIDRIESDQAQISYQKKQPGAKQANHSPTSNPYKAYLNLADYLASKHNYYAFYIDLLMQLHQQSPHSGYDELAFQASERSRARSLRAMLNRAMLTQQTNTDSSNSQAIQLAQPLPLQTIQQQLLDDNTILLEYALGQEQSYLWVVTAQGLQTYRLPKQAEIEVVAREWLKLLQSPLYRVGDRHNMASSTSSAPVQIDLAMQLSQMLLEPVAAQLGSKRLLIASDGILHYLPFAALPKPVSTVADRLPLFVQHEIINLPSASSRLGTQKKSAQFTPTKTIAILADPIFSRDDQRLQAQSASHVETLYPRLPGTRQEANQIAALVAPTARLVKLDTAASRQVAMSSELTPYRLVHIASHGILNSNDPERSGMILSIVDDQGNLQRSLLSSADTFNLELSADLVILSGCTTALGKAIQGEGLVGLTGGLMYAGAKQVMAGLWNVDDEATAALMTEVYQGILHQGLSPIAALRAAQMKLWQSQIWQAPYYWAGFALQGR